MKRTEIVIVARGSSGDVHPFVGLGLELKRRGYVVTVLANGHFKALIERVGLGFIEQGTAQEYHEAIHNPDLWHKTRGFEFVAQYGFLGPMRLIYEMISQRHAAGPIIVVHSLLAIGARLAQEKLGVQTVTVNLSPGALRSVWRNPVLPGLWMPGGMPRLLKRGLFRLGDLLVVDRVLTRPVNVFRAELGLAPIDHIMDGWLHSPGLTLGVWPPWFASIQPDWPTSMELTGFPLYDETGVSELGDDAVRFLDEGEAPIVFTFGSAMVQGAELFGASVDLCQQLNRRGVLLTRYADQIPSGLPKTVRHFSYIPLSQLLVRSAALVHHGGIGTTAQGLAAGIPQLIVPLTHDQPDNASRIVELGAGGSVSPRAYCRGRAAGVLGDLLNDPGWKHRCQGLASQCDGDVAIRAACDAIEAVGDQVT